MQQLVPFSALMLCLASTSAAQDVTLRYWDNQQAGRALSQFQQEAVDRFMEENPDISVEVTAIPYARFQERLLAAVESGNAPDVTSLDQIWIADFAESGAIADLTEFADSAGIARETFFGGAWDSAVVDGRVYGIPLSVDVWQFGYFNRDLLDEAGASPDDIATFEGLRGAAEALTGDGQFGVGLFGHRGEDTVVMVNAFILSNGGEVLDAAGGCALDAPAAVEALEYLQDLSRFAPDGLLETTSRDMRELFLNGSLAIEFWPALEQPLLEATSIEWGFVKGIAGASNAAVGVLGGWNLAILEASENKEAAQRFIEFMVRRDVNLDVVDLIPANRAAAQVFLAETRAGPEEIFQHLDTARPRPVSPRYGEISEIQMTLYQDVYSGADVAEAAALACDAIDALN